MATSAKHDRQQVVQKATHLFWEKGFHATSMRNLQDAIDMRPGSIYASFGSKEGLFKESLRHYSSESLNRLALLEAETGSPLAALKAFVEYALIESRESSPSSLCMLVKTVSELTQDNAELLAESKRLLTMIESTFAGLFTRAIECGELDADRDARRMARLLQMQLMGLRAYARANEDARVKELIRDIFACLH